MPIQPLEITGFDRGLVTAPDPADVQVGGAERLLDVDPRGYGRLRGRVSDRQTHDGDQIDAAIYVRQPRPGLLYVRNNTQTVLFDPEGPQDPYGFGGYGIFRDVTGPPFHSGVATIFPRGREYAPLFLGLDPDLPSTLRAGGEHVEMGHPNATRDMAYVVIRNVYAGGASGELPGLEPGYAYRYGFSFLYDGYQESPIYYEGSFEDVESANSVYLYGKIWVRNYERLDRRVTAINVYRQQAALGGQQPRSAFRFIKSISIDDYDRITGFDLEDTALAEGPSFEESAGFPSTLNRVGINSQLVLEHAGYLFAAGTVQEDVWPADDGKGQPDVDEDLDTRRYLYRSLPLQPSVFDWTRDYAVLPEEPLALASWGGRVWAAGRSHLVRVSPEALTVELEEEGLGVSGPYALAPGPAGLLVATDDAVWMHDGNRAERISRAIEGGRFGIGYDDHAEPEGRAPVAIYDHDNDEYIIVRELDGEAFAFVFNPGRGSWHRFSFDIEAGGASVAARFARAAWTDGFGHASVAFDRVTTPESGCVLSIQHGTTRKAWQWRSSRLKLAGTENTESKLYKVRVAGDVPTMDLVRDETLAETLTFDDATLPTNAPPTFETADIARTSAGTRPRARVVELDVSGSGDHEVASITLFHRPMPPR